MSRKDYRLIAEAIRATHERFPQDSREADVIESLARTLAASLATDNYRFDRDRFMKAAIG